MRIYCDSVVLIYYFEGAPPFMVRATSRLTALWTPGDVIVTSDLVRLECRMLPLRLADTVRLADYDNLFAQPNVEHAPITTAVFDRATGEAVAGSWDTPSSPPPVQITIQQIYIFAPKHQPLVHSQAAADVHGGPGHVTGPVGTEEDHHGGDLLGLADPAQGNTPVELVRVGIHEGGDHFRVHLAWGYIVYVDPEKWLLTPFLDQTPANVLAGSIEEARTQGVSRISCQFAAFAVRRTIRLRCPKSMTLFS